MLHQILKKFKAEGREMKRGEIVETSHWKNERLLLEHRFIGKPSVPEGSKAPKAEIHPDNKVETKEKEKLPIAREVSQKPKPPASAKPRVLNRPKAEGTVPAVGKVPVAKS